MEDGGLDSLQAGLEALFTGEAEELEEEDASDGIVVVRNRGHRNRLESMGNGRADLRRRLRGRAGEL